MCVVSFISLVVNLPKITRKKKKFRLIRRYMDHKIKLNVVYRNSFDREILLFVDM